MILSAYNHFLQAGVAAVPDHDSVDPAFGKAQVDGLTGRSYDVQVFNFKDLYAEVIEDPDVVFFFLRGCDHQGKHTFVRVWIHINSR